MKRTMFRAKVHRIGVTECDVDYEGSLTLDPALMEAAGMVPYERIEVYDVDNAARFATYLIEGQRGSGDCCVNGAAARLVEKGHKLIIATYTTVDDDRARDWTPTVVLVDERNAVKSVSSRETARTRVG